MTKSDFVRNLGKILDVLVALVDSELRFEPAAVDRESAVTPVRIELSAERLPVFER